MKMFSEYKSALIFSSDVFLWRCRRDSFRALMASVQSGVRALGPAIKIALVDSGCGFGIPK